MLVLLMPSWGMSNCCPLISFAIKESSTFSLPLKARKLTRASLKILFKNHSSCTFRTRDCRLYIKYGK